MKKEFNDLIIKSLHKYADISKSINVSGDYIYNSKNVYNAFLIDGGENLKYCWRTPNTKDSYDISGCMNNELIYEVSVAADHWYMGKFYTHSKNNRHAELVFYCTDSSNLFGCIGLRNKQYCILNKQYSKEDYEKLFPQIIDHMNNMPYIDKKGRVYKYGEFFPQNYLPLAIMKQSPKNTSP